MANFHVTGSDDMTALDLSTIANGTILTNTSSKVVIQATDGTVYTLTGDFGGGSGATFPTSGTITGWIAVGNNSDAPSHVIETGLNVPVSDFNTFVQNNDGTGLENEMFSGNDQFNLANGSTDTVFGSTGDDVFLMGGSLTAADSINGNAGFNTVVLAGSTEVVLGDTTLVNIDRLDLTGANTYDITTADATVAAGHTLEVDARNVGPGGTLTFNGSAETDGRFDFFLAGTSGLNVTGGDGNDIFNGGGVGATLNGGNGDDVFIFGKNFDGSDNIDGGSGFNTINLSGDYSAGLTFGATTLQNIDKIVLGAGNDYNLTLNAANDTVGDKLRIDGTQLHSGHSLTFDGSAVAGNLVLEGGSGADTLSGGTGTNVFNGGAGGDTMTANTGVDRFVYSGVVDSHGTAHDTISGFDFDHDSISLPVNVTAIDAFVTTGALNAATFNSDLAHDIGAAQLGANHAVLFTASSGDMAGDTFLIVDGNGVAGYQQGLSDYVIQLTNAHNIGDISTSNFHSTLV